MRRDMHENSLQAYRENRLGIFNHREIEVLHALEVLGVATDREIMVKLGKTDPNYVRPRVTELVKAGVLEEVGTVEDSVSGHQVRKVRIAFVQRPPVQPVGSRSVELCQGDLL